MVPFHICEQSLVFFGQINNQWAHASLACYFGTRKSISYLKHSKNRGLYKANKTYSIAHTGIILQS
jgi:hypothetical protein